MSGASLKLLFIWFDCFRVCICWILLNTCVHAKPSAWLRRRWRRHRRKYNTPNWHAYTWNIYTHRWWWWWWLNRLEWHKWRHSRIVFAPCTLLCCLSLTWSLFTFDYFDMYTLISLSFLILRRFVLFGIGFGSFFGFTFLYSMSTHLVFMSVCECLCIGPFFSVFIFCTLRINSPKA